MTTISVSLDDETYARLKAVAEAEGVSVESLLASVAAERADRTGEVAEARRMAEQHLVRYPDLFKRLAE